MTEPTNPALPIQEGELIASKYRVDRVLGEGGMGIVVAATHLDLDRQVAIKLIREELVEDDSIVERMMLEARSAAKIRSDHVGKVLDVGRLPTGAPYIVMEYLEGGDLCQVLEAHGPLPVVQAVDYLLQACEAVAEAHAANIVHRDLKPENLFVARRPDGSARIKVLDFGISKQLGDPSRRALTNPATAVGSPHYMAPEQMQASEVDLRADIWALGAILYELVSNRRAFDGDTLPAVCAKVLSQQPDPVLDFAPHLPDQLAEVIERCLQKDPNQRFANIAELAASVAPFGSSFGGESNRRISALLGAGAKGASAGMEDTVFAGGSAPTVSATTAGRGVSLSIKEQGSSEDAMAAVPRKANLGGYLVGGLFAAVMLAAGLWFAVGRSPADAEEQLAASSATAEPEGAADPAFGAADPAATSADGVVDPPASETGASSPNSPAVAPVDAGVPAKEPKPKKTRAAISKKPRQPRATKSKRPAVKRGPKKTPADKDKPKNAWDSDNFGGRH